MFFTEVSYFTHYFRQINTILLKNRTKMNQLFHVPLSSFELSVSFQNHNHPLLCLQSIFLQVVSTLLYQDKGQKIAEHIVADQLWFKR